MTACLLDCSQAFDSCRFDKMFQKLLDKKLPAVIIRVLIFIYEEQEAYVSIDGKTSSTFKITNGTRQGAVASPRFFVTYIDELLSKLRQLGDGCKIGGIWLGAAGYSDDLILLAPHCSALQNMLNTCSSYANEHNLKFSTNPIPNLSKTKCMYFSTRRNIVYPSMLKLGDHTLPWVETAEHIGHTLHQSGKMDHDSKIKRAIYIGKTSEIRRNFGWAHPNQTIRAAEIFAGDHTGSNLWLLSSESAESYYKSWNTFVKLVWNVPRSTHTDIVEGLLAKDFVTCRNQILSRYCKFYQSLLASPSREIRILASIVTHDLESTTKKNIDHITSLSGGFSPIEYGKERIQTQLPVKSVAAWKSGMLKSMLDQRRVLWDEAKETAQIQGWIDSLCST